MKGVKNKSSEVLQHLNESDESGITRKKSEKESIVRKELARNIRQSRSEMHVEREMLDTYQKYLAEEKAQIKRDDDLEIANASLLYLRLEIEELREQNIFSRVLSTKKVVSLKSKEKILSSEVQKLCENKLKVKIDGRNPQYKNKQLPNIVSPRFMLNEYYGDKADEYKMHLLEMYKNGEKSGDSFATESTVIGKPRPYTNDPSCFEYNDSDIEHMPIVGKNLDPKLKGLFGVKNATYSNSHDLWSHGFGQTIINSLKDRFPKLNLESGFSWNGESVIQGFEGDILDESVPILDQSGNLCKPRILDCLETLFTSGKDFTLDQAYSVIESHLIGYYLSKQLPAKVIKDYKNGFDQVKQSLLDGSYNNLDNTEFNFSASFLPIPEMEKLDYKELKDIVDQKMIEIKSNVTFTQQIKGLHNFKP